MFRMTNIALGGMEPSVKDGVDTRGDWAGTFPIGWDLESKEALRGSMAVKKRSVRV